MIDVGILSSHRVAKVMAGGSDTQLWPDASPKPSHVEGGRPTWG